MKCSYYAVGIGHTGKIFGISDSQGEYLKIKKVLPHFFPIRQDVKDAFKDLFQVLLVLRQTRFS